MFRDMQWGGLWRREGVGLRVGKMGTSECGVGIAGSRAVTYLGQDRVQFGHEHRSSFKNRSGERT